MELPLDFQKAPGGVTAPPGFKAAGVHAGLKKCKRDLALVFSELPAVAAGVFTKNRVKAAPVIISQENLQDGRSRAAVINSGIANACTGEAGLAAAREMAAFTAAKLGLEAGEVVVASTGVIGVPLPLEKVKAGIEKAVAALSPEGGSLAAEAILTTDTRPKEFALVGEIGGKEVFIGGMAKGAGMICPQMATLLAFFTTNFALPAPLLSQVFRQAVDSSFNLFTVDNETSTNDLAVIFANGEAGCLPREEESKTFQAALTYVCIVLTEMLARDAEGATRLLRVKVQRALSKEGARRAARTVAGSNLVKAALFGEDANWGRIMTALGYAGVDFDPAKVELYLASSVGKEKVAAGGEGLSFSEERAKRILAASEVEILIDLGQGKEEAMAWGCDLSYDYVRINASYRT